MYKEPLSLIYRTRGKCSRITEAGRRWPKPYNIFTSQVLRVQTYRHFLPSKIISAREWQKPNKN